MYDVIVVGGGLAGCSAAIQLARKSHRVALIEADTYPRAKVCGEFLSPESVEIFRQLDFLETLNTLKPATIKTVRITASHNYEWRGNLPASAVSISRYTLDEALIHHAQSCGVAVYTNIRVTDITGNLAQGFTLIAKSAQERRTFSARSVIVAHGKHSNLDRKLDRQFPRTGTTYVGIKQHFEGDKLFEHIDLHTFPGGYCGISQVENNRTNICMLVDASTFKTATQGKVDAVEHFINWIYSHNHEFAKWMKTAKPLDTQWLTIGGVTLATKGAVENDILFAGDAGGMIAPLAGDGMAMALHSGMISANTLHPYLIGQTSAEAMLDTYQTTWKRTFQSRLRLGRFLQTFMLRQSILIPGLRLMNTVPALGNWLMANTRDMKLLDSKQ